MHLYQNGLHAFQSVISVNISLMYLPRILVWKHAFGWVASTCSGWQILVVFWFIIPPEELCEILYLFILIQHLDYIFRGNKQFWVTLTFWSIFLKSLVPYAMHLSCTQRTLLFTMLQELIYGQKFLYISIYYINKDISIPNPIWNNIICQKSDLHCVRDKCPDKMRHLQNAGHRLGK